MERDIYQQLTAWKSSSRRKPLVLEGARQVGKTYALLHFAKTAYENTAYLNFERDKKLADYFESNLDPKGLIQTLSLHTGVDIKVNETLLIFDEIQECPHALNSLKYFCEEANDYHIASAGSLLGIKTKNMKGFPVGKVNFLSMHPLSFFEFLTALNHDKLRAYLEEYTSFEPLPSPLHDKLLELLKYYFFIGGMPEAIAEYRKHENIKQVRDIQLEILKAYERDFSKHAPANQIMKIQTVWDQAHNQLAKENKKFIFSAIRKSARGREYGEAIQWLKDAGLIYKCHHLSTSKIPLSAYVDHNIFKIYLLDIGLLGAQSNLPAKTIIEGNLLFEEYKGALTENYIAQSLMSMQQKNLYYWTSPGTAELDFIIQDKQDIYPLEVKAGNIQKKKSLIYYGKKYQTHALSRATTMNLKHDGKIYNYPLYMINRFPMV